MTRRLAHLPRELLLVAAAACLALSVFLALVAVDTLRWRTAISDDDVRFTAAAPSGAWSPQTLAPFGAAERLLGIEDDVAFRRALLLLRSSKLRDATISDPVLALRRTELADRLESIVVHDPDLAIRSRASSLLGVLSIVAWNSTPAQGSQLDRSELLLAAVASYEQAIELDPENDDAKYNLQLLLRRGEGLLPTEAAAGRNPSAGGKGSRGAGAGAPGSGY